MVPQTQPPAAMDKLDRSGGYEHHMVISWSKWIEIRFTFFLLCFVNYKELLLDHLHMHVISIDLISVLWILSPKVTLDWAISLGFHLIQFNLDAIRFEQSIDWYYFWFANMTFDMNLILTSIWDIDWIILFLIFIM